MSAQFLLRFDDFCPTMNWHVWEQVETILVEAQIKPLIAVVPDNQDAVLDVHPPRATFWQHVRDWQALGWSIGLHGYQHRYVTENPGLMRRNRYSEFAGLDRAVQRR